MNVSAFPLSAAEIDFGFDHVIARFRALESDPNLAGEYCDLSEEGGVIGELLARAAGGELAESAVAGGRIIGDDNVGTVCALLLAGEVERVNEFFIEVDVDEVMVHAPDVLSGIIRGGIPDGYIEDLGERVTELRDIFRRAGREGLCMVYVHES